MRKWFKRNRIHVIVIGLIVLSGCMSNQRTQEIMDTNMKSTLTLSNDSFEVGTELTLDRLLDALHAQGIHDDTKLEISRDIIKWGLAEQDRVILNQLGTYEVVVNLVHDVGVVSKPVYFDVVDKTAPLIDGTLSYTITEGDALDYKAQIHASDNYDSRVEVVFDDATFNKDESGTYFIPIHATDSSGNTTTNTISITVKEKPVVVTQAPQTFTVSDATLNKLLDEIIAQTITDSMTDSQKATAIYNWMQRNLTYRGGAANSNSIETNALYIATNRRGQCQHWAAFATAILSRVGIETLYVNGKGRNYDNPMVYHAWVRVNIDGASLHFDPLYGLLFGGVQFNQVTSEFCNSKRSHAWDTAVYGN